MDEDKLRAQLALLPAMFSSDCARDVYQRAADVTARLAVEAGFRERLQADEFGLSTAKHGTLSNAGCRLAQLRLEEHFRTETTRETTVRCQAILGGARLSWCFSSDEKHAVFIIKVSRRSNHAHAPIPLVRIDATREERTDERTRAGSKVRINLVALMCLENRMLHSGLEPLHLCHILVGYLPEMHDADWDIHERLNDAITAQPKAKVGPQWWRRHWWRRVGVHHASGRRNRKLD